MLGLPVNLSFAVVVVVAAFGAMVPPADAQLGVLTSVIGSGRLTHSAGARAAGRTGSAGVDLMIGEPIGEGDRIATDEDSFAMLFFMSGLGADDIEFEGTIVVEIGQNSTVEIRRGPSELGLPRGRRMPIDVHVIRGRVRAFFDAGAHKDYILLSTPLGEMRVTGSVIYAAHDQPDFAGSVFGTFDSDCEVRLASPGAPALTLSISRAQKVVVAEGVPARVEGLRAADLRSWDSLPDLNMASALAHRGQVRTAYADRTWVGGWVAGVERLEDVASDRSSNIPSQEPELVTTAPTTNVRTTATTSRDSRPRLRAAGGGRSAGDEEGGFGRPRSGIEPASPALQVDNAKRNTVNRARLSGALDGPSGLRSMRGGRRVGSTSGAGRVQPRK